jgi:hypothetical protein
VQVKKPLLNVVARWNPRLVHSAEQQRWPIHLQEGAVGAGWLIDECLLTHLNYICHCESNLNCPNGPLFEAVLFLLLVKAQLSKPNKTFWLYSI